MAYTTVFLVVLACLATTISAVGSNTYISLTNALLARTDFSFVATNYGQYGYSLPTAGSCTNASNTYPTLPSTFSNLRICYGANVGFPYRTSGANVGIENAVYANWATILTAQYGRAITVTEVSVAVNASIGLFPSVMRAIETNQCDVGISTFFKTNARDATDTASCAYARASSGVLVGQRASTVNLTAAATNVALLNNADVVVALARNSASQIFVTANFPLAVQVLTSGTTESITLVTNGTANIAVGDAGQIIYYANTNPTGCGGVACGTFTLSNPSDLVAYAPPQASTTTGTTGTTGSNTGATTGAAGSGSGGSTTNSAATIVMSAVAMIVVVAAMF